MHNAYIYTLKRFVGATQLISYPTYVHGPCRAKLLRAREEAFWTSTSEECSRWTSGSKMVSDTGSATGQGCDGVRV